MTDFVLTGSKPYITGGGTPLFHWVRVTVIERWYYQHHEVLKIHDSEPCQVCGQSTVKYLHAFCSETLVWEIITPHEKITLKNRIETLRNWLTKYGQSWKLDVEAHSHPTLTCLK